MVALRARIAKKRDAISTARNTVPRADCFMWPPASRRDRHRDVPVFVVVPFSLALHHAREQHDDTSTIESPLDDPHRRAHFFPSDILGHPACLPVPIFPMRRVRARNWSREIIAGARED